MSDAEYCLGTDPEGDTGRSSPEDLEAWLLQRLADNEQERERMLAAMVSFYLKTYRPEQAVRCVRHALTATAAPHHQAKRLLMLGQLLEQIGDIPGAAEAYTRGLALDAGTERVRYLLHNNLGYCLNQLGRFAEAEPLCRAAIALYPERYNAHKNLGVALEGQDHYAEAAECYVESTRRNPADPRALRHLESMLARHPEVTTAVIDLPPTLEACRALVGYGRWVQ